MVGGTTSRFFHALVCGWKGPLTADAPPQIHEIVFELCAESLEACLIARRAGAARIELCADLGVDGLTPSHGLTEAAVRRSGLPVFLLLRPRAGDFVYSEAEFDVMRSDLLHGKALGVSGFALGLLHADDRVDVERTQELVELAAPLAVTFHRAFDSAPSLPEALEDVIATGCRRVLTSGGAPNVVAGAEQLADLVRRAAGRIDIAVGGGLRAEHAATLVQRTGARHFHGSVRRILLQETIPGQDGSEEPLGSTRKDALPQVDPHEIKRMVESLRAGAAL